MAPELTINDNYTGDVSDTPPQRRTLSGSTIVKMSVGPMDNNVYILTCTATGEQLIIDAANDATDILTVVDALPGTPAQIVTTHRHPDHWLALSEVVEALGIPTAAGRFDADELPVTPDRLLDDGDTLTVGELTVGVIHLVGHTPGSIALTLDSPEGTHLFTGDSLFPGGVGKTQNDDDFARLIDDVSTKVFDRFADDTVVYPGHGKDTTLGAERPSLPQWRERGW